MMVSNPFGRIHSTGFIREIAPCDARRQLRVSAVIVAIAFIVAIVIFSPL